MASLLAMSDRDIRMLNAAVYVRTSYPKIKPKTSFTIWCRFGSWFLHGMIILEMFYTYNEKILTNMNMSLRARVHSFVARNFKMLLLTTIVPRRFSFGKLNVQKDGMGTCPAPVYENMSPP